MNYRRLRIIIRKKKIKINNKVEFLAQLFKSFNMKKLYILPFIILNFLLESCTGKESLQTYLVNSKDKPDFITLDLSASNFPLILSENLSKEDKKSFESIRKMNIAFLPGEKATEAELQVEREKIKSILKDSGFKMLMKFNYKRRKVTIYYTGKTDAINEIVGFMDVESAGAGIIRILGKNMNPAAILKMMQNSKFNTNSKDLEAFKSILNSVNMN